MRILFTCTYSAGPSGVWTRVYQLGRELIKLGHEIFVLSSNLESGSKKKVAEYEELDGIKIHRFSVISFGSPNAFFYNPLKLRKTLREINPDVVDCQTYRHFEGHVILKECKKLGIRCIVTTHSPFARKRNWKLAGFVRLYDYLLGRQDLRNFDAIITLLPSETMHLENIDKSGKE